MDPEKEIVTQYRAHLQLPRNGVLCDFVGDDIDVVKEQCNRVLNGGCEFLAAPGDRGARVQLIYHPSFSDGRRTIGWINSYEVPNEMSARATITQRLQAA
jgi:hypothetical protein